MRPWAGLPGAAPGHGGALRPAPRLGADADEVLSESGFDAGEVAGLRGSGVLTPVSETVS